MWFRWKHPVKIGVILLLCVGCYFIFSPIRQKIKLGLDLQGGLRALVQLQPNEVVPKITGDILDEEQNVLQNRLNTLGTSELTFQKIPPDRINIEMPGLQKTEEAIRLIREAAVLEMRPLTPAQNDRAYADRQRCGRTASATLCPYAYAGAYKDSGPAIITGTDMTNATVGTGTTGNYVVDFTLNSAGAKKFYEWTSKNVGKPLPIFLDKVFVSGPIVQSAIGAQGQITGNFSQDDAVTLSTELSAGALKVPLNIIETENVGPTLGRIDLEKSLVASLAGLGIVLLFMIGFYRVPGFLADIALVVYCFLMLAYVTGIGVVLTLPGIAGFVLSIGMAVDANVLIFERLKEELWAGRTTRAAVAVGFRRAYWTVFDSHVTTIVGAAVLYWLGTGTVKGFAFTLLWGTVFSLITAVFITRAFADVVVDNDLAVSPAAYGA